MRVLPDLRERIRILQREYFVEGRPSVTDREFDRLFDQLRALEREYPDLLTADSPTHRIGSDLSADFPEVAHTIPVLSLDKAYEVDTLRQWTERVVNNVGKSLSFVLEEKLDGISIVLYYRNGLLDRAVTRGNGFIGNDVTANARTIRTVPLRLKRPLDIAVRGEIILPLSEFDRINRTMETPYANPRNLAGGALRRIKSAEVASVPLQMFAYEGYYDTQPPTHHGTLVELVDLGFTVNGHIGFFSESHDFSSVQSVFSSAIFGGFADIPGFVAAETAERRNRPFEMDGLVAKVDELPVRDELGFTGHHPRWAIAYKFEAPEAATTVRSIDVQVGRTGRITPVARVEPVTVGGARISNVTLHNQDYIDGLELSVGDTVSVSRRGDVIPAIEQVIEKSESSAPVWRMPERCPTCNAELIRDGAHHFCPNYACPDRRRGRLNFFVARGQMDIDNLGPETLDTLFSEGLVSDITDIYRFDYDRLEGHPGFGEKKIALLKEGVERSRSRPFRTVLQSLGIPELGPKAIELLLDAGFRSIDQLFEVADKRDVESLTAIRGLGEKTAGTILSGLSDPELHAQISALRKAGLNFAESEEEGAKSEAAQIFDGQVWCVTGSFAHFKPRSMAMEEVKRHGGRTVADVSGATTHLLAGTGAGAKLGRAQELGVIVVDEAQFLKLIGK
ncbi:MAG TPA: NAD-dependent DNA ligase LigA [Spirochaetia bacterium]|nr:NAD-dependent DNA ligase LigA [Spirochaetia bacterium]